MGAGPTGVEIAGQIRGLACAHAGRPASGGSTPRGCGCCWSTPVTEPLHAFGDRLSEVAARELGQLGVELRMGVKVTAVDPRRSSSRVRPAASGSRRAPWSGRRASRLRRWRGCWPTASGAACDRAGRIEVRPDCTLPDHPEVFAIGDMASLDRLPGVAEVAMQQGLYAAKTIRRRVAGRHDMPPFKYRDLGSVATVGRFRAVVSLRRPAPRRRRRAG